MITGTYKFYLDGEYIGEQKNSITRAGRVIILKSIMGILPTVGGEIHVGLDSTANGWSSLTNAVTTAGPPAYVTYTTSSSHQYRVGDIVTIVGNSVSAYNLTNATITLVPTPTTFRVSSSGNVSTGTGGTVQFVRSPDGLIPNNTLGFGIASSPVMMSFLDNSGNFDAMVFKASFGSRSSQGERYVINELGLFPGVGNQNGQALNETTLFSGSTIDTWKLGETLLVPNTGSTTPSASCYITSALTSYSFRVGDTALFIKANDTVRINNTAKIDAYNLALYNTIDTLRIAYAKLTGDSPTLDVRFKTTDTDYYVASIPITGSQTYGFVQRTISQMETAKVGTPRWSDINEISISSNTNVVIDAVRFNNIDAVDTVYGMVSRAALSTPIIKESNSVLDIEYYLSMAFNKTVT